MTRETGEPTWISKSEASRMLGISRPAVDRLIRDGWVSTRSVPGSFVTLSQADVEKLAERVTIPAGNP